jgi:LPXTG-site transpeptidase (sortase) family protein
LLTKKTLLTTAFLLAAIAGGFMVLRQSATPPAKQPKALKTHASITPAQSYPGLPSRLKVLAIGLDAPVEYVGKTAQGDMGIPSSPDSVGWYKYGALPGEAGTAVMAGHVVGPKGEPGVFTNISKLRKGDTFSVVDTKGLNISFVVTQTKTFGQTEQPTEVFSSSAGVHLNLITCAGEWDQASHQYLQRLVVFADKTP